MDTRTVLEGYLRRAVNPNNDDLDVSAIDQFCLTLKKDPSRMSTARELLVNRIQSTNPKESLLALEALEECMESLGREFRSEINKFRFLNELIKMVSKKYNGDQTPREVSERILNILLTWTNKYEPCECDKIQEAYNLLASQGIQHRSQQNVIIRNPGSAGSQMRSTTVGDDRSNQSADKREQKLRQLISSGKREDFEKANLLIQNFCRDEERRTQMKSRRLSELQKVAENTKLLDEMLDQYRGGGVGAGEPNSSDDELAVLNEIYESCESAHPTIVRLAEETQHCEEMIEKIFEVNDALNQVLDKYRLKVLNQRPEVHGTGEPLLSAALPPSVGYVPNIVGPDTLDCLFDVSDADGTTGYDRGAAGPNKAAAPSSSSDRTNYKDILSDIFTASATDGVGTAKPLTSVTNQTSGILMPETVLAANRSSVNATNVKDHLLEINSLLGGSNGQHQQGVGVMGVVLPQTARIIPGKPVPSVDTVNQRPTNLVLAGSNGTIANKNGTSGGTGATAGASPSFGKTIPELDSIITGMKATLLSPPSLGSSSTGVKLDHESRTVEVNEQPQQQHPVSSLAEEDDPILVAPAQPVAIPPGINEPQQQPAKPELKALADIVIDLDAITPSKEPSRTVLDDKEGLQITLNFAADHPRPDVTVIVISTINQGRTGIPSFQFDASVRKPCKLRLLPPSGTSLPGTKPFRPPADGITQVLLLANPSGEPVDLTCILTYLVGDDPDPIKESIVMQAVPSVRD
ncbi:ADP-ribosylation factor-binding protein GGA1-like [Anopheles albimanus]|uniref:VHS domain-containing protein n=1 Tax=Anopheles albimanus TaxID=7167 RepID=A0A182FU68_ANOAL|nr:ADP-ribosylation factor-binding protein GGA1-like [Anopheles albimanus]